MWVMVKDPYSVLVEQKKNHGNKNIYFLHEIIFNVTNKNKLKLKSEEIINSINKIGFENTANLYSISESARFNGKLGWIEENQLSELIKAEIKKTKIGNYTAPIKIRDGYIVLYVKDKKVEKLFSTGGYMSLPLILAAKLLKIKIYLLEPNLVLGRANKFFLKSCVNIFCY